MTRRRLPENVVPSGGSLNFTADTIPEPFETEHQLAKGRWGVLHVFEGSVQYVELDTDVDIDVVAPDLVVIPPEEAHYVHVFDRILCRVDFFRELSPDTEIRTPGSYANDAVRRSFNRCESHGEFGEVFYESFLNASQEIPRYFENTEFVRQRIVIRDSVKMMVEHDVAEPEMQVMLKRLGETHNRANRNIPPFLYELWLDSVCATVKLLDPEWDDDLDRLWRVRLRPGIQVITAAY